MDLYETCYFDIKQQVSSYIFHAGLIFRLQHKKT